MKGRKYQYKKYDKKYNSYKMKKMVQNTVMRMSEPKSKELVLAAGAFSATGTLTGLFSSIAQGTTQGTRVGDRILVTGIAYDMMCLKNATDPTDYLARIQMVKSNRGELIASDFNIANELTHMDFNVMKVLRNWMGVITVDPTSHLALDYGIVDERETLYHLKGYVSFKKKPLLIHYDSAGAVTKDNVYLFYYCGEATNFPSLTYRIKVYFKDF